jgi:hypothetical protein
MFLVKISRLMLLFKLSSYMILYGDCACDEKIVAYQKKDVLKNGEVNILSNTTVNSQDECRDVCCTTLHCKMAAFTGSLKNDNCVLYHCDMNCEEVQNNSTVLLVKKSKGEFFKSVPLYFFWLGGPSDRSQGIQGWHA